MSSYTDEKSLVFGSSSVKTKSSLLTEQSEPQYPSKNLLPFIFRNAKPEPVVAGFHFFRQVSECHARV